jgi:hypothetical protein
MYWSTRGCGLQERAAEFHSSGLFATSIPAAADFDSRQVTAFAHDGSALEPGERER